MPLLKSTMLFVLVPLFAAAGPAAAADHVRVGVYDSRVVAYAHFWTPAVQQEHQRLFARARAAKKSGDQAEFDRVRAEIEADQKRSHLQVFSTAPAEEAMAALEQKLPAIRKELGVERLVSKWDAAAADIPEADRVDATDRLARELLPSPTEKQRKVMESMKSAEPLPLWKAKQLVESGGL